MKLQGVVRTPNCQLGQQTVFAARTTSVGHRRLCVTAVTDSGSNQQETSSNQISRRDLGYAAAALSLSQLLTNSPAFAEGSGGDQQAYIDPEDAFKLIIPTNWASSEVRCSMCATADRAGARYRSNINAYCLIMFAHAC